MQINNLFDLSGQVAIVTGGTGLFGKPISLALAEAGATTIITSRNGDACREYSQELSSQGYQADSCAYNQGDQDSIASMVSRVENKYGRIDVLVNNAVTRDGLADLDKVTKTDWEDAQKINSTGLMLVTQAVIKNMVKLQRGSIINIGSIQGVSGPRFPVYGDTGMSSPINYTYEKWGMIGFTKWIANKYGPMNIRCNCLSPGGFGPGVEEKIGKNEFYENYKKLTPLGRFASEDDIKGPIVFLASAASAYVTGHNLMVDGGWSSW